MTPRTLVAFAAGALVGSLVQAMYDARAESRVQRENLLANRRRFLAQCEADRVISDIYRARKAAVAARESTDTATVAAQVTSLHGGRLKSTDALAENGDCFREALDAQRKAVDQTEPSATDEAERERKVAEILDMNARYARWRAGR